LKAFIKKVLKSRAGFSLAETLMAIMILLMASAIVGAAIPAASNVYQKSVDVANAQVVLSTTITMLRDQLSTAGNTKISGKMITYTSGKAGESGVSCLMKLNSPTITVYKGSYELSLAESPSTDPADYEFGYYDLVSKESVTGKLAIDYESISQSGQTITFHKLVVQKDGTNLTEPRNVSIRVLS
jgi:type II secretory pathway pseudopilin PulG